MLPETRAISNKPLINISYPRNPYKINTLIFDETGKINVAIFDTFDQLVSHWSTDGREEKEQVDFTQIGNACILYQIAEREGQIVGVGDFNKDKAIESIIKHISDDIQNKQEVALDIYTAWFTLTQKVRFIENVSKGRVKVERSMVWRSPGLKAINPIPDFKQFIRGLINAYINTVANEQNIQSWTLEQAIQLLLSNFTGSIFNDNAAKQYFTLHAHIEDCISNKQPAEQANLRALQERLKAEKGEWLTSLNIYIEQQFINNEIFTKPEFKSNLKIALEHLCLKKFDKLQSAEFIQLFQALEPVIAILQADGNSKVYVDMIQPDRADNKPVPSIDLFKVAAIAAIKKVAKKEANIDLELDGYESTDKVIKHIISSSTAEQNTYEDLIKMIDSVVAPYEFNVAKTYIFESTLLRLAGIYELPTILEIAPSKLTPQFFFMDIAVSPNIAEEFVNNLNEKFGMQIAQYTPKFNRDESIAIKLSIDLIIKHVITSDIFRAQIEQDCAIEGYRDSLFRRISYAKVVAFLEQDEHTLKQLGIKDESNFIIKGGFLRKFGVNGRSDFIEGSIIQSFGVQAIKLKAAQFSDPDGARSYLKGLETDFYLGISLMDAMDVVENINKNFPNSAYIVASDVKLDSKGDINLQHIAIKNRTLTNIKFLEKISFSLFVIAKNYPNLLENWQVDSGKKNRCNTKNGMLDSLAKLSQKYIEEKAQPQHDPNLSASLKELAKEIDQKFNPHRKEPQVLLTSFYKLQKSMQLHEFNLKQFKEYDPSSGQEQLQQFIEDKLTITTILDRVCPRL